MVYSIPLMEIRFHIEPREVHPGWMLRKEFQGSLGGLAGLCGIDIPQVAHLLEGSLDSRNAVASVLAAVISVLVAESIRDEFGIGVSFETLSFEDGSIIINMMASAKNIYKVTKEGIIILGILSNIIQGIPLALEEYEYFVNTILPQIQQACDGIGNVLNTRIVPIPENQPPRAPVTSAQSQQSSDQAPPSQPI